MPYTETRLPFSGSTPASQHASFTGAQAAAHARGRKTVAYLRLVTEHGSVSDEEAEVALGYRRSSICSIRNGCVQDGEIIGDGTQVVRRDVGRQVTHALWRRTTNVERILIRARQQQLKEARMDAESEQAGTDEQKPVDQGDGASVEQPAGDDAPSTEPTE